MSADTERGFFIDLTKCDACRGCQVACEQWHDFGTIPTKQTGTHQNPPDLNYECYKIVRFEEKMYGNKLEWLFFPEQCRQCFDAPCQSQADFELEGAIITDPKTGIVLYTEKTKEIEDFESIREACPYNIPRRNPKTKMITKCDLCIDRIENNMVPACVQTCHSGTMNYGSYKDMVALATKRLEEVKKEFPNAVLGDMDAVHIIYLFPHPPKDYYQYAVAENSSGTESFIANS